MGTSYTTIIRWSQLVTNIDTVLLSSRIYLNFISFPLTWSRIPSKTHIKSGNHVSFRLLWLWQSHRLLLFLMTLMFWGVLLGDTVEHLSIWLGQRVMGKKTTEMSDILQSPRVWYALSTRLSLISSPHHLVKVAFPRFLLVNFYFYFPTFHTILFRRKSPCTAHT